MATQKKQNNNGWFKRHPLHVAVSFVLASHLLPAYGQEVDTAQDQAEQQVEERSGQIEQITVTATKQATNMQKVPLSVNALTNETLENLNIQGFEDYINFLPTVSYLSYSPGLAQIYMRGISSGGDGIHSGSQPSVAVYLDEQPITTINNVLDVHVYDVARIETLAGPQGTLYGASSQAGTMRIITNQPDNTYFDAGFDVQAKTIKDGGAGYTFEGFVNVPINDAAALRVVAWYDKEPGYIDNVYSERLFRASGIRINNADLVEEDFNEVNTEGLRALLKVDLNENWSVTPGITVQSSDSTGVWSHNPDKQGDLKTGSFNDEFTDDEWYQGSLTVNGKIGDLDVVYAGAVMDRDYYNETDYSAYAEYMEDLYAEYGYYCLYYDDMYNCVNPNQYISSDETFSKQSHEIRFSSPQDERFRWIAGVFYQKQEHDFDLRWVVPEYPTTEDYTPIVGEPVVWVTDQLRTDKDMAVFGEASYDITEKLTVNAGLRFYELENSLFGYYGNNGSSYCAAQPCLDYPNLDKKTDESGSTWKANASYEVTDDALVYVTYSKGFRPGGTNRALTGTVAPSYKQDFVYNHEFGWKTSWMDNRLRFNGAAYFMRWDDFQYAFLDYQVSPVTLITNVGQSETLGFEFDTAFAATPDLMLNFSGSYNDATLQEDYYQTIDDREAGIISAPKGTKMPLVPEWKLTGSARYHMEVAGLPAYMQLAASYTGASWNLLETDWRTEQDAYTLLNFSAGFEHEDGWNMEFFINNITDERAQVHIPWSFGIDNPEYTTTPRKMGIRFGWRY
ncbi:TonB-dependent receptor [Pseudidiomarina sp.]|uniref:TonB-dependent receptor n=1 Tax=Pseudidiomarina sp. TaxID=2081707 RepID=UPI003A971522